MDHNLAFQLNTFEPVPAILDDLVPETAPRSPSRWFSFHFPEQSRQFGPPILEGAYQRLELGTPVSRIKPVALNEDFFAAILGGDPRLGHKVIFYPPESFFYFFDPREGCFVPTTEAKLRILLSQHLIRCAREMPSNVDIQRLFIDLRSDKLLDTVIARARSILAADQTFFARNRRKNMPGQTQSPLVVFIREVIVVQPDQILTIPEAYSNFCTYAESFGAIAPSRPEFKQLAAQAVKEAFGLGLRNDLRTPAGKCLQGWKGITCRLSDTLRTDGAPIRPDVLHSSIRPA